jgi:quercetin dioxygenase-like cupin family protein
MEFIDWNRMDADDVTHLYRRKVALGETLTIAKVESKAGATTQPHHHESEEVIIVLKGAWRFFLPTGEVVVRANQALAIPPGVEHASEVIEDTLALDICTGGRLDWLSGDDRHLHHDPDDFLWAV